MNRRRTDCFVVGASIMCFDRHGAACNGYILDIDTLHSKPHFLVKFVGWGHCFNEWKTVEELNPPLSNECIQYCWSQVDGVNPPLWVRKLERGPARIVNADYCVVNDVIITVMAKSKGTIYDARPDITNLVLLPCTCGLVGCDCT